MQTASSNMSQRANDRVQLTVGADVTWAGGNLHGHCLDASKSGMFVQSQGVLAVGTAVGLSFQISAGPRRVPVRIEGSVARCLDRPDAAAQGRLPGLGIRFLSFRQGQTEFFDRLAGLRLGLAVASKGPQDEADLWAGKNPAIPFRETVKAPPASQRPLWDAPSMQYAPALRRFVTPLVAELDDYIQSSLLDALHRNTAKPAKTGAAPCATPGPVEKRDALDRAPVRHAVDARCARPDPSSRQSTNRVGTLGLHIKWLRLARACAILCGGATIAYLLIFMFLATMVGQ